MKFDLAKAPIARPVEIKKRRTVARLRDAMQMIVDGGT
jgi:hypothetical protein